MAKTKTFSDEVREAIRNSGLTRYRICKEIGLAESAMSKFFAGEGGLSMEVLDKIAPLIGMHISTDAKRKGR